MRTSKFAHIGSIAWKSLAVAILLLGTTVLAFGANAPGSLLNRSIGNAAERASLRGYGISDSFYALPPVELDRRMSDIRASGAEWVRYDLNWSAVQAHGAASYDWSTSDRITAAANRHDLRVVMILDLTPQFQRVAGCNLGERCAPVSPEAFGVFAGNAAQHYRAQGVNTWEIWNEPNIAFRFGPATDPRKYVAMLKNSYNAIKQADPSAVVIAGSTAPAASENGDLRPLDFLREMYAEGAQGYFDAISAHPYTYPLTPSQSGADDAWGQMIAMHEVMTENSDGDKRIWITEFGAPTNGPNEPRDHVSEAVQAVTIAEAASIYHGYSWSGPLFWYGYKDAGTSRASSENFYGLVRADGSKKPAYDAFVRAHQQ